MPDISPSVSIVMSVFNGEKYLYESVKSILNQTFGNFEFIIINDGSTDSTFKILQSFKDSRIRLISRENQGLTASLNEGIALANGCYVARMDADDIALPDRLYIQYHFLQKNPGIDGVGGQAWLVNQKGKKIGSIMKPISPEYVQRYMEYACPLIHPTYMIKNKVYSSVGGYRPFVKRIEDFDFLLRASDAGFRFANVPDVVLLYRQNSNGISSENPRRTMYLTRIILKLHRLRKIGKQEEDRLLKILQNTSVHSSRWFNFCHNARNALWNQSKRNSGMIRGLVLLLVFLFSLMHYELLFSSFRGMGSLRWMDH